jgi:hypothetical protein
VLDSGLLVPGASLSNGNLSVINRNFAKELPLGDLHASVYWPRHNLTGEFGGNLNSALGFSLAPQDDGSGPRLGPVDSNADLAQFSRFQRQRIISFSGAARLRRRRGITAKSA